ncbi:MAG: sulfur carrier protein ThiS [Bacteroidia bacterium]|nr:sulfur carrier protein ThiS [Bacteroidia bacterium]
MALKIILNNKEETIEKERLTVAELLQIKNFIFKMLVVKVNETLVKKQDYDSTVILPGDKVTVLHLMSGG